MFGTAAFVTGLPGLDDLNDTLAEVLRYGIVVVAAFLLIAVLASGLAATSFPKVENDLSAVAMRTRTKEAAIKANKWLRTSIGFGAVAAVLFAAGFITVALADQPGAAPSSVFITSGDETLCGKLGRSTNGSITVDGELVTKIDTIVAVTKCPPKDATSE